MIDPASNKLAQLLISRRIELGHQNRAGFARHHELNSGQQRTIEDMENARRINYRASTKAFVEHIYQWAPGSIDAVLEDGEPTPVETATRPATSHITDEPDSSDRFKNFISKIPPAVADLPLDEQQRLIEEIWSAIRRHNA